MKHKLKVKIQQLIGMLKYVSTLLKMAQDVLFMVCNNCQLASLHPSQIQSMKFLIPSLGLLVINLQFTMHCMQSVEATKHQQFYQMQLLNILNL